MNHIIAYITATSSSDKYYNIKLIIMKTQIKLSLKEKLLIYIHHILPMRKLKLSHKHIQATLYKVDSRRYSLGTLRKELSILRSCGLLTHKLRYRRKVPILSLDGKLSITPVLAYKSFGDWDAQWRVVAIRTPRDDRKYQLELIAKMQEIGFKKVLRGVYITPHPFLPTVDRLATHYGIRQHCLLLETDNLYKQNIIAERIWDLEEIARQYKKFITATQRLISPHFQGGARGGSAHSDIFPFRAKLLEKMFCDIYARDPHLPPQLLPARWHAAAAYKHYRELINRI